MLQSDVVEIFNENLSECQVQLEYGDFKVGLEVAPRQPTSTVVVVVYKGFGVSTNVKTSELINLARIFNKEINVARRINANGQVLHLIIEDFNYTTATIKKPKKKKNADPDDDG